MNGSPIIPGYYPDPSICRVGEDYFLVTSSFEYFPGVPIFTSRDLVSWRQLGNVLDRRSQLNVQSRIGGASGGIYAPTIRHHDGRFWMCTTNIHDIMRGHLIVHSTDPAGPWSDPVYAEGLLGIDPDLAWDADGICWMTWSDVMRGGLSQARIDPLSGAVLSEPTEIWRGTGAAHAEGPHLIRRGAWWYLIAAEGGTHTGHMVTVARSRRIDGPFESNPANPILTHRSLPHAVQSTGHADLVELPDGTWAMVHLATRPRGSFPKWHVNGRETFLVGIDWVDDWPVVAEDRPVVELDGTAFVEEFDGPILHPRWVSPGVDPATFCTPGANGATLTGGRSPAERDAARMLVVRARDAEWTATLLAPRGDVALTVRIDDAHQASVQRVGRSVSARVVIGPLDQVVAEASDVPADCPLVIRSVAYPPQPGQRQGPDRLVLGYERNGFQELVEFDGRYLSTEVAGGFTGRMIGIEALGESALVRRFSYSPN